MQYGDEVDASGNVDPRQGDYLPEVRTIYLLQADGSAQAVNTPRGVLLLTQCCDLARQGNGQAHVAAVVELAVPETANARSGRTPRYIALDDDLGGQLFGDLGTVGGMTHDAVANAKRVPGVPADERHLVGDRVARRFSRFAYPDAVMPLIGWVVNKIRDKARSEASPLGAVFSRIERIRVELDGDWSSQPWSLALLLIVPDGELPTVDGEYVQDPSLYFLNNLSDISRKIADAPQGSHSLLQLWEMFSERLASDAIAGTRVNSEIIEDFRVEIIEESELTYFRFRRTTALDVDHISGLIVE